MKPIELTNEITNWLKEDEQLPWGTKQVYLDMASTMIIEQEKRIQQLESVLQSIANEQVELSHDKMKWQIQDHIRWAKEVLK